MPRPSPIGVAVAEAVEVDVAGEEDPSDVEVDVVETESAAEVVDCDPAENEVVGDSLFEVVRMVVIIL